MGIGNGEVNDDIDDELSWRVAKLRLEEANTRRFLKARPIKLSYRSTNARVGELAYRPWDKKHFLPNFI